MVTSKYLKLSSWGTALIPGTLFESNVRYIVQLCIWGRVANGSCMSLSVSLMIRFGKAAIAMDINQGQRQINRVNSMRSCYFGEQLLSGEIMASST